jgi:hypothetical protein
MQSEKSPASTVIERDRRRLANLDRDARVATSLESGREVVVVRAIRNAVFDQCTSRISFVTGGFI